MQKNISEYNFEKGDIGEELVRRALRQKNYVLAFFELGQAHPCDNFVIKWDDMKLRALDIKTYPRRFYYPDTGINYSHYLKYKKIEIEIPFYLIFVDDIEKKVYGNSLLELKKETTVNGISYPLVEGSGDKKRIYFPLQNMEFYFDLSDDICKKLRGKSGGDYYDKRKQPKQFDITWQKNKSWN